MVSDLAHRPSLLRPCRGAPSPITCAPASWLARSVGPSLVVPLAQLPHTVAAHDKCAEQYALATARAFRLVQARRRRAIERFVPTRAPHSLECVGASRAYNPRPPGWTRHSLLPSVGAPEGPLRAEYARGPRAASVRAAPELDPPGPGAGRWRGAAPLSVVGADPTACRHRSGCSSRSNRRKPITGAPSNVAG